MDDNMLIGFIVVIKKSDGTTKEYTVYGRTFKIALAVAREFKAESDEILEMRYPV